MQDPGGSRLPGQGLSDGSGHGQHGSGNQKEAWLEAWVNKLCRYPSVWWGGGCTKMDGMIFIRQPDPKILTYRGAWLWLSKWGKRGHIPATSLQSPSLFMQKVEVCHLWGWGPQPSLCCQVDNRSAENTEDHGVCAQAQPGLICHPLPSDANKSCSLSITQTPLRGMARGSSKCKALVTVFICEQHSQVQISRPKM